VWILFSTSLRAENQPAIVYGAARNTLAGLSSRIARLETVKCSRYEGGTGEEDVAVVSLTSAILRSSTTFLDLQLAA
jgi:hypothetical protein